MPNRRLVVDCEIDGVPAEEINAARVDRIPPGEYHPDACEICGRKDGLHDDEDCFK